MNFSKIIFLAILVIFGTSIAYFAVYKKSPVSKAFCRALNSENSYIASKQEHLKFLIPGRHGWVFRSKNDFRSDYSLDAQTKNYLLALQEALKTKNIDLVIVYPPIRGLVHADQVRWWDRKKYGVNHPETVWDDYENAIADWQKTGLNVVGINRNEVIPDFYYKRNHHWTASGARIAAHKVSEFVHKLPSYQSIPKTYFVTVKGPPQEYDSSFRTAFKKMCGTRLPPESTQTFSTAPSDVGANVNEQALFDQVSEPQITLLGTSNSVEESSLANFEGFLKEELNADINNMAYIGSGIDTSIISFLNSDSFESGRTRIVIWEVPSYYDFNLMDDKLFQQAIPAAYGPCPDTGILVGSSAGMLKEGDNVLFDFTNLGMTQSPETEEVPETASEAATEVAPAVNPASQILNPGKDFYLHFRFSDPVKEPFSVKFYYTGGGTKRQELERAEGFPHDNKFYTLFPLDENNANLKKITLDLPASAKNMSLVTQVCALPENSRLASSMQKPAAKTGNIKTVNNPQP